MNGESRTALRPLEVVVSEKTVDTHVRSVHRKLRPVADSRPHGRVAAELRLFSWIGTPGQRRSFARGWPVAVVAHRLQWSARGHLKRKFATWLVVSASLTSNWRHVPFQAFSVFQT